MSNSLLDTLIHSKHNCHIFTFVLPSFRRIQSRNIQLTIHLVLSTSTMEIHCSCATTTITPSPSSSSTHNTWPAFPPKSKLENYIFMSQRHTRIQDRIACQRWKTENFTASRLLAINPSTMIYRIHIRVCMYVFFFRFQLCTPALLPAIPNHPFALSFWYGCESLVGVLGL